MHPDSRHADRAPVVVATIESCLRLVIPRARAQSALPSPSGRILRVAGGLRSIAPLPLYCAIIALRRRRASIIVDCLGCASVRPRMANHAFSHDSPRRSFAQSRIAFALFASPLSLRSMRAIMRTRGVAVIPLGHDGTTSGLMRPQQRKAYSIALSARATRRGGIFTPSSLAASRLMTSSQWVFRKNGTSAGLSPFSISTICAPRPEPPLDAPAALPRGNGQVDSPLVRGRGGRFRTRILATGKKNAAESVERAANTSSPPSGQVVTAGRKSQANQIRNARVVGPAGPKHTTRPLSAIGQRSGLLILLHFGLSSMTFVVALLRSFLVRN
jgi:hypothetical protein